MPRTCLACSNSNRAAIDAAIATGEPLREIAGKSRISISALHRHKTHAGQSIAKASEKREESIGESILARLEKLYQRGERVLDEAERSGDGRLALQAIRETREVLAGVFTLASKAAEAGGRAGDGGRTEFVCRVIHLGTAPIHEWEELPASAAASLPGRPKGTLYLCRKYVGKPSGDDD